MKHFLLVGAGGFAGSAARYLLSSWVQQRLDEATLPYGTLTVNVVGCCVLGFLVTMADMRGAMSPGTRMLLMVGFCGGFTTFSTFGYETLGLIKDNQSTAALANVGAQVLLGLGGVWLGGVVARLLGGAS